jgi:hypothetical protein
MENTENKSLCAKATLIDKAMNSFKTKSAQYILYNKDDKNISMFEVTAPYSMLSIRRSVITKPENQVTTENIENENIAYYQLDVVDEGNDGVCVNDVGNNKPTDIGKYVVIGENNNPMIVTITETDGEMVNVNGENVDHDKKNNRYYKIQGAASEVAGSEVAGVPDPNALDQDGKVVENPNALDPVGEGAQGGAPKKKRRNPTKKGRKSGKKGRKSGKKSRKSRRSRRSKK